jgi:hypothetical protein
VTPTCLGCAHSTATPLPAPAPSRPRCGSTRVLVLDANQRSALAITRSLGRDPDITVLTADDTDSALAGASRFSSQYLQYPSPEHEPAAFVGWLAETLKARGIDQVFPATEISSYLCLMHRELLPCELPFPPWTR